MQQLTAYICRLLTSHAACYQHIKGSKLQGSDKGYNKDAFVSDAVMRCLKKCRVALPWVRKKFETSNLSSLPASLSLQEKSQKNKKKLADERQHFFFPTRIAEEKLKDSTKMKKSNVSHLFPNVLLYVWQSISAPWLSYIWSASPKTQEIRSNML